MPKNVLSIDTPEAAPKRGVRPSTVVCVIVTLAAAPLVFDGGRLIVGRWRAMLGPSSTIETPALDFAHTLIAEVSRVAGRSLTSWTHRLPWPVDYAVAGLVACAIVGAIVLNRGRWS